MLPFVYIYPSLYVTPAVAPPKIAIIVALAMVCFAIVTVIACAAYRGKFHMAGYIGVAFAAFAAAMIAGKLSGVHGVSGTALGLILSLVFFFAIATVLGCLAALVFYRAPREPIN